MRKADSYLKYVGLAIAIQMVLAFIIWVSAFVFSPALDALFGVMITVYWPMIYIIGNLWRGELAAILLGLPLGMIVYGFVAGFVISLFRRKVSDERI